MIGAALAGDKTVSLIFQMFKIKTKSGLEGKARYPTVHCERGHGPTVLWEPGPTLYPTYFFCVVRFQGEKHLI